MYLEFYFYIWVSGLSACHSSSYIKTTTIVPSIVVSWRLVSDRHLLAVKCGLTGPFLLNGCTFSVLLLLLYIFYTFLQPLHLLFELNMWFLIHSMFSTNINIWYIYLNIQNTLSIQLFLSIQPTGFNLVSGEDKTNKKTCFCSFIIYPKIQPQSLSTFMSGVLFFYLSTGNICCVFYSVK